MSLIMRDDEEVEKEIRRVRNVAQLEAAAIFVGFAVLMGIIDWVKGDSLKAYGHGIAVFFLLLLFVWIAYSYYSEFSIRTKRINGRVASIEAGLTEFRSSLEERLAAIEKRLHCELDDSNSHIKSPGLSEGLKRLDQVEKEVLGRS
jgi:hypothetical protein